MNRPWVICHMCTSLDGKISGDFMETATAAPALRAYNELRGFYDCRATLYGDDDAWWIRQRSGAVG